MNENIFRILATVILFTRAGTSIYFRRKAARETGERLSRDLLSRQVHNFGGQHV